MPDTIAPSSPATPQTVAQPASPQSTAPAGIPTQVVDPAISKEASSALGAPAGTGRPEPAGIEEFDDNQGQPSEGADTPAQPADGTTPQGAEGAQPQQPVEQPLPGEDYLTELAKLLPPDEATPTQVVQEPDITKPEELEKIINPDGKADPETRLKNAQSYIGKLQQQKGEEIKGLRAKVGELLESGKEIRSLFTKDQQGQMVVNAKGSLKLAMQAPPHEMEAALAEAGVKLVPLNAKVDMADDPAVSEWENEWANAAIPGSELTVEEKLAQIQGDARLSRRMTVDQAAWQSARRSQYESQQSQNRARQQAEAAKDQQLVDGFMAGLQQKPDYKTFWLPAVRKANALIPNSVRGQDRLTLVNIVMHALRVPSVMREAVKTAKEQGRKEAWEQRTLSAVPASGEHPDLTTGELQEAETQGPNGAAKEAALALGARPGRI